MPTDGIFIKVVGGTMLSMLMAVGGLSWTNQTRNETQEIRLAAIEAAVHEIVQLRADLAQTNQSIALLNLKLAILEEDLDDIVDGK